MSTSTLLPKTAKQRRRLFNRSIMNFRVLSKETNSAIAIIDTLTVKGGEPPRHMHTREDELFIIHSGEVIFFIGDNVITARQGDIVFAPRGVAHHFKILSASCKATLIITPGNFDEYFWQLSFPYDGNEVPEMAGPPSPDELKAMAYLMESYGIENSKE